MKKILFCLLVAAFSANAQVVVKPGLRAGLNLSKISSVDSDFHSDFYTGGYVAINFKSFYTLQPELTYSRQGAKFSHISYYNGPDPIVSPRTIDEDMQVQYLSLGVINKFNIAQGFHVLVGPSIDLKIGDNTTRDLSGGDLAFHGGFGYQFPAGFGVEIRYKQGLSDVFKGDYYYNEYDYSSDVDIRLNQVIQIGAFYTF